MDRSNDDRVRAPELAMPIFRDRLSRLTNDQLQELALKLERSEGSRTQLVAFITTEVALDPAAMRAYCTEHLPDYMLPQRFETIAELPRTNTGKVDTHALQRMSLPINYPPGSNPQPAQTVSSSAQDAEQAAGTPPYDLLVERITAVWRDVLDMDRILPDDDYFELGGDSISNLQIIARCAKQDIHFGPVDLLQNPTVALLARWLVQTQPGEGDVKEDASEQNSEIESPQADATKAEMLRVLNLGRRK